MIGTTVSHYTILEKLGGGGMGVVYKAQDTRLKRTVALKFLPAAFGLDPDAIARFKNEAEAASSLQHNNICTVHDIDETSDGQLFIVMDFYEGETLKKKIERGPLKIDEAIGLALQVAQGLAKAHEHGIVHRDIKPANIMVTSDGVAKIVDFGLAKLSDRTMLTKTGSALGTVAYMSPEQTKGEVVDSRTDIWSLGVLLYEMITGQRPFKAEYENAVVYSILNSEPEPMTGLRTGLPMELERIVSKCLAKESAERYQHADELLVDLKSAARGADSSPALATKLVSRAKVRSMWVAVMALAVLAMVCGTIWVLMTRQGDMTNAENRKSIAVLLFTPITKSEEDTTFAEGIQEDILTQLAKIKDLTVIAKKSVLQYRDSMKPVKEIAKELGVDCVLEGSTRRAGNSIRITAQLIDAESQKHIWAETYDRPYADIFAVQSDVAQKIAGALGVTLAPQEKASIEKIPTSNLEAYGYFQRGIYYWRSAVSQEVNDKAIEMFEHAVSVDSGFAAAYAWISYIQSGSLANRNLTDRGAKAKVSLDRAMALDPSLPEVHMAAGEYAHYVERDFERSRREFMLALNGRPNDAEILDRLGVLLVQTKNLRSGIEYLKRACTLDPNAIAIGYKLATAFEQLRSWPEAEQWANFEISRHPDYFGGYMAKVRVQLFGYGDLNKAQNTCLELRQTDAVWAIDRMEHYYRSYMWRISLYSRDYAGALKTIPSDTSQLSRLSIQGPTFWLTLKAKTYEVMDSIVQAAKYYAVVRRVGEKVLQTRPADYRIRVNLGIAYAALGLNREASTMAKLSSEPESFRDSGDKQLGAVEIYIRLHEFDRALGLMEHLLSIPSDLTQARLRLDPVYDALRGNSRFQALLAKGD
jgi:TolB-like protein